LWELWAKGEGVRGNKKVRVGYRTEAKTRKQVERVRVGLAFGIKEWGGGGEKTAKGRMSSNYTGKERGKIDRRKKEETNDNNCLTPGKRHQGHKGGGNGGGKKEGKVRGRL